MAGRIAQVAQGITAAPEEKVVELLKKMDELLKADDVAETKVVSAKARNSLQGALALGEE